MSTFSNNTLNKSSLNNSSLNNSSFTRSSSSKSAFINSSFIAQLGISGHYLNLLKNLHGDPAMATELLGSGGFFAGRPQLRDDSNLLGYRSDAEISAVGAPQLFFSGSRDGYNIFILDAKGHIQSRINKNRVNLLEAVAIDSDQNTLFNMTNDQGEIINLDGLDGDNHRTTLMTENDKYIGGMTIRGSNYRYLAQVSADYKMAFELKIIERL